MRFWNTTERGGAHPAVAGELERGGIRRGVRDAQGQVHVIGAAPAITVHPAGVPVLKLRVTSLAGGHGAGALQLDRLHEVLARPPELLRERVALVGGDAESDQQPEHGDRHHHLDEREASLAVAVACPCSDASRMSVQGCGGRLPNPLASAGPRPR